MKKLNEEMELTLSQLVSEVALLSIDVESLKANILKESEIKKELEITTGGKPFAKLTCKPEAVMPQATLNIEREFNKGFLEVGDDPTYVSKNEFIRNEDDSITLHDGVFKFGNKVVVMSQGKAIIAIDEKGFTINP